MAVVVKQVKRKIVLERKPRVRTQGSQLGGFRALS